MKCDRDSVKLIRVIIEKKSCEKLLTHFPPNPKLAPQGLLNHLGGFFSWTEAFGVAWNDFDIVFLKKEKLFYATY